MKQHMGRCIVSKLRIPQHRYFWTEAVIGGALIVGGVKHATSGMGQWSLNYKVPESRILIGAGFAILLYGAIKSDSK